MLPCTARLMAAKEFSNQRGRSAGGRHLKWREHFWTNGLTKFKTYQNLWVSFSIFWALEIILKTFLVSFSIFGTLTIYFDKYKGCGKTSKTGSFFKRNASFKPQLWGSMLGFWNNTWWLFGVEFLETCRLNWKHLFMDVYNSWLVLNPHPVAHLLVI